MLSKSVISGRDRFLQRAVGARHIYAVAGADGLARMPSRHMRGRDVTLLWSQREDAERWASSVESPRIKELPVAEVVCSVLPALAVHKRLVGLDWSAEIIEPEVDPRDLAERLRLAAVEAFIARVVALDAVWTLGDVNGPALLVSGTRPDVLVLPCWSSGDQAEARTYGPWSLCLPMKVPLADFLGGKMAWLERQGYLVAPDHMEGPGALELEVGELRTRLEQERAVARLDAAGPAA